MHSKDTVVDGTPSDLVGNLTAEYDRACRSIAWNMAATIGYAGILLRPEYIDERRVPELLEIDGLRLNARQALGLSLPTEERAGRADEVLAMARRMLLAETVELTADVLARSARAAIGEGDPYLIDSYFSVDLKELWNTRPGRAGSLLEADEREYFEKLLVPIRNIIRHNNGILPPKKAVTFDGIVRGERVAVAIQWVAGGDNAIRLQLESAFNHFKLTSAIGTSALGRALQLANGAQ